ncbi:MAG: hypothetical protein FLDDKLPJ_02564 [Phycisphaerae bacterium]|nr:hypothetical protein [Phycisphaerae bacterium]
MIPRGLTFVLAAGVAILTNGCHHPEASPASGVSQARLYDGLGGHRRKVTTASHQAQQYFNQGLIWAYAFNHDEAIRSFRAAAALDPDCAMAHWGVALCHGPHINNPVMTEEAGHAAWAAIQDALSRADKASPTERALIAALAHRYADPPPTDRRPLDEAYAEAMRKLWLDNPGDGDIGALYAEAMMDLQPWDLWTRDGQPKGRTPQILTVLEQVLRIHPNHPGALHLYIHAVEAARPELGIAAADRLRNLVPASGHLVHMPSHIDVLTGRWETASRQNEQAIRADRAYRRLSPTQGFYRVYMSHNHHMLMFASMMEGRREVALRAARQLVADVPEDYARTQTALVDPYLGAPYDVMKRFGMWQAILDEPAPPDYLPITNATWRHARAIAYAATDRVDEARREHDAFRQIVEALPDSAMYAINPAKKVLSIGDHLTAGEIALREGKIDDAVAALRRAVEIEDDLQYMEPPEWVQPVRHTLGAVLVSAGRYDEAETVYREDLDNWPENGWSLHGLAASLEGQGQPGDAAETRLRFSHAWRRSDTPIPSSCLCVTGTRSTRPASAGEGAN